MNCGAFTDELLLSELFGHEKGAFTNADRQHVGLVEQADEGTLFLDEIDSLSAKAQVVLLRLLQEREYRSVGGNSVKRSKARIVTASNRSLEHCVEAGKFRQDLFYRVDIFRITLPKLCHRGMDVFLLAQYFLRHFSLATVTPPKGFHSEVLQQMYRYPWPGNIRELENFVHRHYYLSKGAVIETSQLENSKHALSRRLLESEGAFDFASGMQSEKARYIDHFEKCFLTEALKRTRGNVSAAAKMAKKDRRAFTRLMEKHRLSRSTFSL